MAFRVGQKVVCVDASPAEHGFVCFKWIVRGRVYTVRSLTPYDGLLLEEVIDHTRPHLNGRERGFKSQRFRPIVERKTDISIFKAMLNPQGVDA
jgi:hypothetical protein